VRHRVLLHRLRPGVPVPRKGARYLVTRLWPKGFTREELDLAGWFKRAAPPHALRRWYGERLERWNEYREEVRAGLEEDPAGWSALLAAARDGPVVLLHDGEDDEHNHAAVLRELVEERLAADAGR